MTIRLSELKQGGRGKIITISGSGNIHHRLSGMGVVPGCEVEMRGPALRGEPFEILVDRKELSLCRKEADSIKVELV